MNRILIGFFAFVLTGASLHAQDRAMAEQVNRLRIQVEDLLADKARQRQEINDLTREVERLKGQVAACCEGDREEDLNALRATVSELNRKHQKDMDFVADQIEKLGRSAAASRSVAPSGAGRASGFEYTIEAGNTLSAIAAAYQAQGYKVTVDDILKANPGLDPNRLQLGQVIIIPDR